MLSDEQTDLRRKFFRKVGDWASVDGIILPGKLCTEQCSSQSTAIYKAGLALSIAGPGATLTDLTGGLGVDSWAFAQVGLRVRYNEMNRALAESAASNFHLLGCGDIVVSSVEVTAESVRALLCDNSQIDTPEGSIVYLDPSRRDASGKKVFLLEDCSPDILTLKDRILDLCPDILLKLSPMADISMVTSRLGPCVREVHVVGCVHECKELLVWMQRGWSGGWSITVKDLDDGAPGSGFRFTREEEAASELRLLDSPKALQGLRLWEPGPAMLKAGAYKLLCSRMGLAKLGCHAQLYVGGSQGRLITEVHHFNGAAIKALGKRFPKCEVTARNIPMTSDALRKRMGVSGGGAVHIYAVGCDFTEAPAERLLLVTLA